MIYPLSATFLVSLLAFIGIWLIHVRLGNAGVVDYYWGPGFAVIAMLHGMISGFTLASAIVTLAVLVWAVRLSAYLFARHRKSGHEDARYAAMRAAGGGSFWWKSLFTVFLLQGLLQWVIAAPLHALFSASQVGEAGGFLFLMGMAMFVLGFVVESVADQQVAQFKAEEPASNGLMTSGLWKLVRHPNYLGEMILWCGIGLASYAASNCLVALAGPVILMAAMVFVSIPLTETHLRHSRPQYESYAARTPMLIPRLDALSGRKRA